MYRERGMVGSKSEVVDRKRINEIHDNRPSHSMSQPVNGKGKVTATSVLMGKQQLHDRDSRSGSISKTNISDGEIRFCPLYRYFSMFIINRELFDSSSYLVFVAWVS